MPEFTFEAVTKNNETQSGQIAAASTSEALASLESQGLTVLSLQQVDHDKPQPDLSSKPSKTLSDDPLSLNISDDHFLRERTAALLEKRETLAPALKAFADEMPAGRRRRELRRLATRLHSSTTVDELCQSNDLATTWLPLLGGASSLESGRLLNDLLAESSRENAVHRQRIRLFAYPLFILVASLAVLVFLSVTVVPTFGDIFDDFDLDLPGITLLVVSFSRLIRFHFGFLLLITAGCVLTVYVVLRLLKALKFPGRMFDALTNGNSRQLTVMATFVRRLTESLNTGLPLPMALRLAGQSSGKPWLRREAAAQAHDLETSRDDNDRSPRATGLPATVVYALYAGDGGGPNVHLLQEIAEVYAERVRNRFNWSTGFLPQISILVVGFVVASVVLALFLPLVSLINGLSG